MLGLDPDNKLRLHEQGSMIFNSTLTSPKKTIELPTKSYVDSLHENSWNSRELSSVFNNQDKEIDKIEVTNINSVSVNRNHTADNEVSKEKDVDDSIGEGTRNRYNQSLENYLKASVGNDTYVLSKNDRRQITDTTTNKYPNTGRYLLQQWNTKCNHKKIKGKSQKFIKSTQTNCPMDHTGATLLPPIRDSFTYIETSQNNSGNEKIFVSFQRTDVLHVSNITFYCNRYSISTDDLLKSMCRFKLQHLLEYNTWNTRYNIPKNDR